MPPDRSPSPPPGHPAWRWREGSARHALALLAILLAVLAVAGLGTAVAIERHDPACAACHLPPERAFVARAAADRPVDLASAHAQAATDATPGVSEVLCVDCHGGPGWRGQARALRIGARDAWRWLRGDFVVVGHDYMPLGALRHPMGDEPCLACHAEIGLDEAFANHFHHLLDNVEAPTDLRCVACHAGHRPREGSPYFLTDADLAPGCAHCHAAMGGPRSGVEGLER